MKVFRIFLFDVYMLLYTNIKCTIYCGEKFSKNEYFHTLVPNKLQTSILVDIEDRLCQALPNTFEEHYRQRVAELFSRELKPMSGVLEILEATKFPKCIASSGPPLKIHLALQVSGLAPYFGDSIFSSYEVGSWKPEQRE